MKRLQPIGTHVLVVPFNEERVTEGGIIIPETHQGGDRKGVVEEKGRGNKWEDMNDIKKGDIVTFGRNSGTAVNLPNDEGEIVTYLLLDIKQLIVVQ